MAKTLQEFKKEFETLKKIMPPLVDKVESNENNLNQFRELLVDGFKQLGVEIHRLRDAGTPGTKIENFMHDREVAVMVKELQGIRDRAKKAATETKNIHDNDFKPIKKRMATLQENLADEIAARKKKFSSQKLGVNQSVKEMEPLAAEISKFVKGGNKDFEFVVNFMGSYPPDQFERLYNELLAEELTKSKAVSLNAFQQMMQQQMLNVKNLQKNFMKTKSAYQAVTKAVAEGKAAHIARNPLSLGAAKRDGAEAFKALNELVEPYEKAVNDAKIKDLLAHSQDKSSIEKGVGGMREMLSKAKQAMEELEGRVLA